MSNIIHRDSLDTDLDQHKSQSVKSVASLSFAFKKSEKRPDFGTNKNHMLYRRRQALHSLVFTILNMIIASEVPRRPAGSKSIQRRRHKRKDATLFGTLFLFVIILVNLPLAASGQEEPAEQEEPVVDPLSIPADDEPPGVNDPNLVVEEIVAGLKRPTAMSFLGNSSDDIIVTEKDNGTVRRILGGVIQPEPLVDVAVSNDNDTNERGLLGMALSKQNETTTYVFLYYTESGGGQDGDDADGIVPAGNRLYRYELVQNDNGDPTSAELINPKLLLDLPARPGPRYNGGPLLVTQNQSDTFVYLMIGDLDHRRSQAENYEDGPPPDGTGGILVVDAEGNPLPSPGLIAPVNGEEENGEENIGMLPYYFAYGIRNGFGMAFDPVTGYLWDTENGPEWFDEINLVVPGFNSGWAAVSGPASAPENEGADIEEDLETFDERGMYRDPEFAWQNTVGVTGIKFLNSTALGPQYENDIFVGDINHGRIYHFDLNQERTGLMLEGELQDKVANNIGELESVIFGTGFRSITDIEVGPDGNLYVLLYGPGKIFKISLADTEDD
ncbi:MAG TPA: PQQ-dependent sugar dehydrogenase [Nitrososphaera sp.]|nr:PQQ-dependent sugar dehydrogenase [Nitrososphaera sp.]